MLYIAKIVRADNKQVVSHYSDDCILTIRDDVDKSFEKIIEFNVMDKQYFAEFDAPPYGYIDLYGDLKTIYPYDFYFLKYADSVDCYTFDSYNERDHFLHNNLNRLYNELSLTLDILGEENNPVFIDDSYNTLLTLDNIHFITIADLFYRIIQENNLSVLKNKHIAIVVHNGLELSVILIKFVVLPKNFIQKFLNLYTKSRTLRRV